MTTNHPSYSTLGVRVHAVQIPDAVEQIQVWIDDHDGCHYVAVTGMHGVMEAHHDPAFKSILNNADLVVPDGMPFVWLARFCGFPLARRVYGPELMASFCQATIPKGYRHFFFGGAEGVPEKLAAALKVRFPNLRVVGTYSPPFRQMTPAEDDEVIKMINATSPDIIWVGLSTPKQEKWMHAHRNHLHASVLVGVGAAFDILSGLKKQAPSWMREHGLESVFRLMQEPRRLWRRYVIYGSEFVVLVALQQLGLRKFP